VAAVAVVLSYLVLIHLSDGQLPMCTMLITLINLTGFRLRYSVGHCSSSQSITKFQKLVIFLFLECRGEQVRMFLLCWSFRQNYFYSLYSVLRWCEYMTLNVVSCYSQMTLYFFTGLNLFDWRANYIYLCRGFEILLRPLNLFWKFCINFMSVLIVSRQNQIVCWWVNILVSRQNQTVCWWINILSSNMRL
jgi:hypothetical protein